MANKFKLDKVIQRFENLKSRLPKKISDESASFFRKSFDKSGFQSGITFDKWPERKKDTGKNVGRKLLVKTGRLKRSIRVEQVSFDKSVIATDVPYAQIHNEGGTINKKESSKVINFKYKGEYRDVGEKISFSKAKGAHFSQKVSIGAHVIKMPKRKFMGKSRTLDLRINTMINQELKKVFNG